MCSESRILKLETPSVEQSGELAKSRMWVSLKSCEDGVGQRTLEFRVLVMCMV